MLPLVVDAVVKRYGKHLAVDQVSFEARPGRILGILGPNGAGKTTTIRMIAHVTVPDAGRVLFGGQPVGAWSQQRMGYMPEERGLYKKLKVEEQLMYFGQLRGLSRQDAKAKSREWLERLGGADWGRKKTEELSKGMQQKVQFASTMMHDPDLVILDEPFSGLDPINAELLRDTVLSLREAGKTVLFASHRMEQVERLVDDVCLIAEGKVAVRGTLREVKQQFGRDTVQLDYTGSGAFVADLEASGRIRVIQQGPGHLEAQLMPTVQARLVLEAALAHVDDVVRFELAEPSLQEIFVRAVNPTA